MYLDPPVGDDIIRSCNDLCHSSVFCTYEQLNPFDAFGQKMISNLAMRNIRLPSLESYNSLETQEKRYINAGFTIVQSSDLWQIWKSWNPQEKQRLAKLEIIDEIEEFQQLMSHYCIIAAKKDKACGCGSRLKNWSPTGTFSSSNRRL